MLHTNFTPDERSSIETLLKDLRQNLELETPPAALAPAGESILTPERLELIGREVQRQCISHEHLGLLWSGLRAGLRAGVSSDSPLWSAIRHLEQLLAEQDISRSSAQDLLQELHLSGPGLRA